MSSSTRIAVLASGLGVALAASVVAVSAFASDSPAPTPAGGTDEFDGVQFPTVPTCERLLDRYVDSALERVTAYGWDYPYVELDAISPSDGLFSAEARSSVGGAEAAPAPATVRATGSGTGTNVQEAGVDEPDVVKTDGTLLVRLRDGALLTYDVTGSDPEHLASLPLPDADDSELLLVGDRAVVLAGERSDYDQRGTTRVLVVDLADPEEPEVVDDAEYDAAFVTARQHGSTVRLVVSTELPDLPFVHPRRWWRDEDEALERNREIVRETTLADWLPTVTRDDDTDGVLDCSDVTVTDDESGLGTLAVVGFDPASPDTWSGAGITTDSTLAYFSTDRMYLATGSFSGPWIGEPCCVFRDTGGATSGSSHLYSFALDGAATTYVAAGEVDGYIADRWSMDEYAGVLRVAVGPTWETGNFNSIVTLREEGDDLVESGRVDKLGVNEQIESMRWFDGLAIMVTFRQVDPLYAVDLTDPSAPRLMGTLKIPGFSEYLHPLGSRRLVGVGQDADLRGGTRGAQAALFDVSDLTDPRRLDTVGYGFGTTAGAATDPRQFTWLPDRRTVLTVIADDAKGRTGWVSVLELDGGDMENRMVEVEYGEEVADVRLVPLPDGRVLLVTGDEVSSFDL
jgi:hypothetical protein